MLYFDEMTKHNSKYRYGENFSVVASFLKKLQPFTFILDSRGNLARFTYSEIASTRFIQTFLKLTKSKQIMFCKK